MSAMAIKKFPGPLSKRIPKGTSDDEIDRIRLERLEQLFEHYDLSDIGPQARAALLAWRLALDCVPGLQVDQRGRETRPDKSARAAQVYMAVRREITTGGYGLEEACQRIGIKQPFRRWRYSPATLAKMYRRIEALIEQGDTARGIASLIPKSSRPGRHQKSRK